jgi:phage baseplate assembly protein gpV
MFESLLKLYSLGIIVEDKPVETDIVLVSPLEHINIQESSPILDGETKFEGSIKGIGGSDFKTEIKAKNYFRAKWLPFGHSNRTTSPNVIAGETVMIFKFGDVDEYYWTTIFNEPILRRLEKVLYSFGNMSTGKATVPYDQTTSYWFEVDTVNKLISFHTSMNDGEYTEYDITINTAKGNLRITDKKGNYIYLDSPINTLTINTNKDVIINTTESTFVNAGKNVEVDAGSSVLVKAGKTVEVDAGSLVRIDAPTINITGKVNIKGDTSITGNVSVKGNIKGSATIMDASGNSNHHKH